ncbi:hypothetical protein [Bacillus sp. NPDC094106]|uniref:hypothetical protein n=1 Tax=Bacillus sp. NPDC094106 TaxID=3363949 RepID=UPI003821EA5A
MKQNEIIKMLEKLSMKERKSLESAISAIYFADKSDYLSSLWEIVTTIIGEDIDEEGVNIENILKLLDPALINK